MTDGRVPARWFIAKPDQLEEKIERWRAVAGDALQVDYVLSYSGHKVYALTLTSPEQGRERKRAHYFAQPHAHEPGATAGMVDVIEQILTGHDVFGQPTSLDVQQVLDRCVLTFNPIGNPQGRKAAPVLYWDGSRYSNDEFWCWMRGEDPARPGHMWKRLDVWDRRVEENVPERLGIVYEQVDQYRYVEPNRSQLSSYFRLFRRMDAIHHYDCWLDLHQTEFVNSSHTCEILLAMDGLASDDALTRDRSWGQQVIDRWISLGYAARPEPRQSTFGVQDAQYFRDNWGPLHARMLAITTEVKNNAPDAPPEFQMKAESSAIVASIEHLMADGRAG